MENENQVRSIGNRHPITVQLINKLITGKPGDSLTDSDLTKVAGLSTEVHGSGYAYLLSAIRHCERIGTIWQRVAKEKKIICMNAEEIVARSENDLHGIRRRVNRSSTRMSYVEPEKLPPAKRSQALATSALLGAIAIMSRPQSMKKLINNNQASPQIGDAFKLFEK